MDLVGPVQSRGAAALVLVVLLAGCTQGPGAGDAAAAAAGDGLVLRGVVVDEALRPLAGATVTAGDGLSNSTARDGTFSFQGLPAGVYVVRAGKPGFADSTTQVVLAATQEAPLVKLVLVADASTQAYVDAYAIEGFVECGVHFVVGYFAVCSGPNTATTVACPATGVCLGNVTGDRSLILVMVDRPPQWLQMEAFWEATVPLAEVMRVQSGATSPEEVSAGNVRILNETDGPSPNLNIIAGEDLAESRIGVDSYVYMRLHTAANPPVGGGLALQQSFRLIMHLFHGFEPPQGWRFSIDQQAPLPPA